jgi:hypothetical protein
VSGCHSCRCKETQEPDHPANLPLFAPQESGLNAHANPKDDEGLIDGVVTYEDHKPVKGATAYAVPFGRPIGAIIPHAENDETGYYVFTSPVRGLGSLP